MKILHNIHEQMLFFSKRKEEKVRVSVCDTRALSTIPNFIKSWKNQC